MSAQQSQRSQNTHHSERFNETKVDVDENHGNGGRKHNDEIENVPCIPDIRLFSAENETECENLGKHFANEKRCHDVIDIGQYDSELGFWGIKWSL